MYKIYQNKKFQTVVHKKSNDLIIFTKNVLLRLTVGVRLNSVFFYLLFKQNNFFKLLPVYAVM